MVHFLILFDLDADGLADLQGGGLLFVHVEAGAIVTLGDGEAGDGIALQGDEQAVFVLLAPALATRTFFGPACPTIMVSAFGLKRSVKGSARFSALASAARAAARSLAS